MCSIFVQILMKGLMHAHGIDQRGGSGPSSSSGPSGFLRPFLISVVLSVLIFIILRQFDTHLSKEQSYFDFEEELPILVISSNLNAAAPQFDHHFQNLWRSKSQYMRYAYDHDYHLRKTKILRTSTTQGPKFILTTTTSHTHHTREQRERERAESRERRERMCDQQDSQLQIRFFHVVTCLFDLQLQMWRRTMWWQA